MKQNIEIEVPEGFEAKYNPETQKIELVKKDDKPKIWEEFSKSLPKNRKGYTIINAGRVIELGDYFGHWVGNFYETREEAEAFLALMKLRQLRKTWVKDWKADWKDRAKEKYIIYFWNENIEIQTIRSERRPLSFPTKEMAEEFLFCFRDLINTAKILL